MAFSKHQQIEKKIFRPEQYDSMLRHIKYLRFLEKRIVFTNGCFDLLHAGHTDYLARAADLGDVLIIGLNTDSSVSRLKGRSRPLNNQEARARVLASLAFVDSVILFEKDTPAELITAVRPDVLVKGGDYSADEIAGADIVRENGGRVLCIPLLEGYSTSGIIEKILAERNKKF